MVKEEGELIFGLAKRHYHDLDQLFKQYPSIQKVIVFGSRAKGTHQSASDFDLAIIAPTMTNQEFAAFWSELNELPILFKFDVVHWDQISNMKLKGKIIKEGKDFWHS